MLPKTRKRAAPTPEQYADSDGFSPGVALLAYLPGATTKGLPTPLTIDQSLSDGSPTVLIERINRGPDGKPAQNGVAEYPFVATIPKSAETGEPAAVLWYGHGQLGSRTESLSFRDLGNEGRFAIVSSDWSGFAEDDLDHIIEIITSGNIGQFPTVADRMQQGILNALLLTRMATGRLADAPEVVLGGRSAIRKEEPYYFGGSQGGILGGTYMALSTDVKRGILAVLGQSYNLLLQMHWDKAEPTGYSSYIRKDMLPGTPAHEGMILVSIGDHQVTTLGAHIMARAIGVKNLKPINRSVFGNEEADGPFEGSAMVEFDFGLPPEPLGNEPMRLGEDPHGSIRQVPAALVMISNFLRQGKIQNFCPGSCNPD